MLKEFTIHEEEKEKYRANSPTTQLMKNTIVSLGNP